MKEMVILVDESDRAIGTMEKMAVHAQGELHRAFSIFIFNEAGDMLLQKRADSKYHSGGLWTNACCSHPKPDEPVERAARRRLQEELGFQTELEHIFSFTYRAEFDNGLIEHEFDHVFIGSYSGEMFPDPKEVQSICFLPIEEIEKDLQGSPTKYTAWFRLAFPQLLAHNALRISKVS